MKKKYLVLSTQYESRLLASGYCVLAAGSFFLVIERNAPPIGTR